MRQSFQKYPFGAAVMRNMIPTVEGAMIRRPGTRFVHELLDSSTRARLLSFVFSTLQAYMLVAEAGKMTFNRNQGQIFVPSHGGAISNGTFDADITDWDDRSTGGAGNQISHDATNDRLTLETNGTAATDIGWAEQDVAVTDPTVEMVLKFRVIGAPGDRIELRVGTTSTGSELVSDVLFETGYHCHALTPGEGNATVYIQFRNRGNFRNKDVQIDDVSLVDNAALQIDSPYGGSDLTAIKTAQSADVMYSVNGTSPPYKLSRFGNTSWSLTEVAFEDGPYLLENEESTTLQAGALAGLGVTVTASSTTGINEGRGFLSTDIGRSIRIQHSTNEPGWGVIVGVNSTTQVSVDVRRDFNATTTTTDWRLGAWSATTGYPSSVGFYEQRIVFAATANQPQTFWLSQSADLENMRPDSFVSGAVQVEDDDALDFTMAADQVNAIRWLSGGKQLFIGTVGGEWLVTSDGAFITPSDIEVKQQTTHGSADIQPARVGHVVLFVQSAGRRVRELVFDFNTDGLLAPDMTSLASHILRGGVEEIAFQEEPLRVLWCVRGDGVLAGLTYEREENVVGWARHVLGGSFSGGEAVVESVASIPGNDGAGQTQSSADRDEVWVIVKRTINGVTKRYVEFMEGSFEGPLRDDYETEADWKTAMIAQQADAYYADSMLTYNGAATTSVSGLDHLEGEEVVIWADGAVHPRKTVSGGGVAFDYEVTKAQIGLPFEHTWRSLKNSAGAARGTAMGQKTRIHFVTLILQDAVSVNLGPDVDNLYTIPLREVSDLMDTAVPLFSGELEADFDGDWDSDPRMVIQGDDPGPLKVLAIAPRLTVNEL